MRTWIPAEPQNTVAVAMSLFRYRRLSVVKLLSAFGRRC